MFQFVLGYRLNRFDWTTNQITKRTICSSLHQANFYLLAMSFVPGTLFFFGCASIITDYLAYNYVEWPSRLAQWKNVRFVIFTLNRRGIDSRTRIFFAWNFYIPLIHDTESSNNAESVSKPRKLSSNQPLLVKGNVAPKIGPMTSQT